MRRRAVAAAGVLACLGVLVACGGGDADPSTAPPTTDARPAPDTATTPTAAASAACAGSGGQPVPERIDVSVDGRPRSALVHVPSGEAGAGAPLPVVVSFHGVDGSAAVQRSTDGLVEVADREGFVVVHPEGLEVGLNDRVTGLSGWDHDGSEIDEPAFVAAVLDELGATVCIDTDRVFATGFSAGGNIAMVVACALGDRIAAVAPVGAAHQPGQCSGAAPVPVLAFHGRDDIVVPFDGRDTPEAGTLLAVRGALEAQARRNGCADEVDDEQLSPRVRRTSWSGCEATTALVELDDHGHAWPGHPMPFDREVLVAVFAGFDGRPPQALMVAIGEQPDTMADNVLLTNDDVDATEMIWEFFSSER